MPLVAGREACFELAEGSDLNEKLAFIVPAWVLMFVGV